MLHGKIETRLWRTDYRGPVLICAGVNPYSYREVEFVSGIRQLERINDFVKKQGFFETSGHKRQSPYRNLISGHAIAIGNMVDCRKMNKQDEDKCFVKFRSHLWCHIYEDVRPIEPFPYKGKLGLTKLSEENRKKIILL